MTLFSVIIPVYNIQEYVNECVASVLGQTLSEIEVILVDDGSTDDSGAICDSYAIRDNRVRVIHQENGGLSAARNAGVLAAKGEYVVFVDGDDYYDDLGFLRMLSDHLSAFNYPDMTVFGRKSFVADGLEFTADGMLLDEVLNGSTVVDVLGQLIATDSLAISAGTRTTRRDLLIRNSLLFQEGLLSEDIEWSLRVFNCVHSISLLNTKPYTYRKNRPGSITNTIGAKNVLDGLATIEKYANEFEYSSIEMREVLLGYVAYQFCIFGAHMAQFEHEARQHGLERLQSLSWLLEYDSSPKVRMVRRVSRLLGLSLTVRILEAYLRYRRS